MLRTNLAKEFFGLDDKLEEMMDSMKQEVVDILSSSDLRLDTVFGEHNDPKESIDSLAKKFEEFVPGNSITTSLINFAKFKLLYRGIMYNDVREELKKRLGEKSYNADEMINWSSEEVAIKLVDELYADALIGAVNVLHRFNTQPDRTVNAITEELVDGIAIYANTENEWRKLLRRYKDRIWANEFEQIAKITSESKRVLEEKDKIYELFQKIDRIQLKGGE
jgi:hypothetical protein